jgi:hypothetical protein
MTATMMRGARLQKVSARKVVLPDRLTAERIIVGRGRDINHEIKPSGATRPPRGTICTRESGIPADTMRAVLVRRERTVT